MSWLSLVETVAKLTGGDSELIKLRCEFVHSRAAATTRTVKSNNKPTHLVLFVLTLLFKLKREVPIAATNSNIPGIVLDAASCSKPK